MVDARLEGLCHPTEPPITPHYTLSGVASAVVVFAPSPLPQSGRSG
ncbi:MAG UNVERIFIED_CONTAM: hypothetical protein LVT10_01860 [Anaerolineae bacterium]